MQEGPQILIATQDDVAPTTPVASIRPAFGYELLPAEMYGTGTAIARAHKDLHIIDKIRFIHFGALLGGYSIT